MTGGPPETEIGPEMKLERTDEKTIMKKGKYS
jgi:hypothetical protein